MTKVYLGVIKDLLPDDCVMAVRHYLDFYRMAHYESHTDSSINDMERYLEQFWMTIMKPSCPFLWEGVIVFGWSTPKLHYLRHYGQYVRQMGSLIHYSTDRTEAWHKPIKDAYNASNRGAQAAEQILRDLDWDLAWALWEQRLRQRVKGVDIGMENDVDEVENVSDSDTNDVDIASQNRGEAGNMVQKTVTMRGTRFAGIRQISWIAMELDLPCLVEETLLFLDWIRSGRTTARKRKLRDLSAEKSMNVTAHKYVNIQHPTVHDPRRAINATAWCVNKYQYFQDKSWTKPRHDTVLVRWGKDPNVNGHGEMRNRRVALVRVFFCLMSEYRDVPYQVALVQWFGCSAEPDAACGMFKLKKKEEYAVIEIDTFERPVHLIPAFGKGLSTAMATCESTPALDIYDVFWLNNQSDLHIFNTIY